MKSSNAVRLGLAVNLALLCITWYQASTPECYAQDITNLGGDLSSDFTGREAIQVTAPNVIDDTRRLMQLEGFSVFHNVFDRPFGLGPRYVNKSCGACHVDNGRGPIRFSKARAGGSTMVIKVSLRGVDLNGSPRDVPGIGEQLLDHTISGKKKIHIDLKFEEVRGKYPDGTLYSLRKPNLQYSIEGMSRRGLVHSLRMTPPVIGPGLLEAAPDSVVLEYSDPADLDGDGISGHPNYVPNKRTGGLSIGRFGFRASHPTVEQQSCAAAFNDIGVTNPLFSPSVEATELDDSELNLLVIYQKIAGVPKATNQNDSRVVTGKALFQSIKCDSCHRMTMTTSAYVDPELSNQTFHPFTDLLLHDMGRDLADNRNEFSATGREWKTTPLWGLGFSRRLAGKGAVFLHDGRARTIEEAILWHGGESAESRRRFKNLRKQEREDLLLFLESL